MCVFFDVVSDLPRENWRTLVGLRHENQISYIETGNRTPRLAEVLKIELIFGVPAVTIFPQIRNAVGHSVSGRVKRMIADLTDPSLPTNARVLYKTAQLERVVASLRTRDDLNQGENRPWQVKK